MRARDALSLAVELGTHLEAAGLPYAIGGALALGIHGVSRSTQDVDVNVFVEPEGVEALLGVLSQNGVTFDADQVRTQGVAEGIFFSWANSVRIGVFLPSIELSWEALRTRVAVDVQGRRTWFLSQELDLERLVASSSTLNRARVRQLMVDTMGENDERVRAWDDIVVRCAPE